MEEQSQNGGLENHSEDESGSVQDPLNMDRSHKTNPTLHHSTKRFAVETKPCLSNVNSFDATPSKSSQHPATGIGHSISNTHWPATETRHPSHISDPHEGTNPLGNPHTTINTSESLIFLHSPSHSPQHTFSQDFPTERAPGEIISTAPRIAIIVPRVERRWEYRVYNEEIVVGQVLRELQVSGRSRYLVRFTTGQKLKISAHRLVRLPGGSRALQIFKTESLNSSRETSSYDSDVIMVATRRSARIAENSSPDELSTLNPKQRLKLFGPDPAKKAKKSSRDDSPPDVENSTHGSTDDTEEYSKPLSKKRPRESTRISSRAKSSKRPNYVYALPEDDSEEPLDTEMSQTRFGKQKQSVHYETRRSARNGRQLNNLMDRDEEDIPDRVLQTVGVRAVGAKEVFKRLSNSDDFRVRHMITCDTCGELDNVADKGPLIYCQGCSTSYHQVCLGPCSTRDHLVTKVGPEEFVLQCRRCVDFARKKDAKAPRLGRCQVCQIQGPSCIPFRDRKTPKEEQKLREENQGEDPVVETSRDLINNVNNTFFRCIGCRRAFHFHHLPARPEEGIFSISNDEEKADKRFYEHCLDWQCKECYEAPSKLENLIAWRPLDKENYKEGQSTEEVDEDEKQYLIKWKDLSYLKATWEPGSWVYGVTNASMRKAFCKRDNEYNLPKMNFGDAIPEDYLRVDIVFEVRYTSKVSYQGLEIDKARVREVAEARVKFKGLGYEDVVWAEPPDPQDIERYADYKSAYEDWVLGKYLHVPNKINTSIEKARKQNFAEKIMIKMQPTTLSGGVLREHQMDGINWLLSRWHSKKSVILADEMGLGKTIQIVGFLTVLQQNYRCWPFLIVVPNSTCANWRREIKQWAPSLRVVMYFGSATARELALKYEMFPDQAKDLRCHVVITSYDTAQDESCQRVFHRVAWAGLIVDEGQRLKNDESLLYLALRKLIIPFKILLTGTPLQNNMRELFSLLQFLDPSIDAQAWENKYPTITKDNLTELHAELKPLLLRRTKVQVLKDLPPMASIIVPVTRSSLQTQLYKGIFEKNAELLKAIFGGEPGTSKVTGMRNILMELRKCLCHPFVYNISIEERNANAASTYRALVEASPKFQLLEIMLPKLKSRGHRVLIFSQFLDMLTITEDFLDGLGLQHLRIDGSMGSIEKQKRIDKYNAPDSPFFACILSTRAGGVGINLATADTVIILDPDFNPHQDMQALSRAHRMGQKNKVLVFQLMTRDTVEEKIMQVGKKKLALENVIIERMDLPEQDGDGIASILSHGTEALFKNEEVAEIKYDSSSVDKLLDRAQAVDPESSAKNSTESQFSFARVWANNKGTIDDGIGISEKDGQPIDPGLWDEILAKRALQAKEEKARQEENSGRGKRQRKVVQYQESGHVAGAEFADEQDSDVDFEAKAADTEGEESAGEEFVDLQELQSLPKNKFPRSALLSRKAEPELPTQPTPKRFKRAVVNPSPTAANGSSCVTCGTRHAIGHCPLKLSGTEQCQACGTAHYGGSRACPVVKDPKDPRKEKKALPVASGSAPQYVKGSFAPLRGARPLPAPPSGTTGSLPPSAYFGSSAGRGYVSFSGDIPPPPFSPPFPPPPYWK